MSTQEKREEMTLEELVSAAERLPGVVRCEVLAG